MTKKKFDLTLILFCVLFSAISSLISIYPATIYGLKTSLFSFEPDVPYVANAMSYIYTNTIQYSAHPATPSIVLMSYTLLPLRMYSKMIAQVPFYVWTINNQNFLFLYERYYVAILFFLSNFIFIFSLYSYTKQYKLALMGWLGLWAYTNTPYLGIIIQSEPLTFLIVSIWLFFLLRFSKNKSIYDYVLLCLISGIAIANKLPNLFFVFSSLSLSFFLNVNLRKKLIISIAGFLISVMSFIFFTWPIRTQYSNLWLWIVHLSTHSGIHGRGGVEIFNLNSQFVNLSTLFSLEKYAFYIIFAIILLWVLFFIKTKFVNWLNPYTLVTIWMIFGILVFSKFPLSHYSQFHFLVILFLGIYLLKEVKLIPYLIIISFFSFIGSKNLINYWQTNILEVNKNLVLEEFVKSNPTKTATVWEWARSTDYSLLHIRDWSGSNYGDFLKSQRPNLYNLSSDMTKIIVGYNIKEDVFSVCWDKMYIQDSELPRFLEKYSTYKFDKIKIVGSKDMWLIKSNHCNKNE